MNHENRPHDERNEAGDSCNDNNQFHNVEIRFHRIDNARFFAHFVIRASRI